MNSKLMYKQIQAAIAGQDQLVFVYRKKDELIVRFVTPIKIAPDHQKVLCAQHLPNEGYRYFFFEKIEKFHRVIARDIFAGSSFFQKTEVEEDQDHQEID